MFAESWFHLCISDVENLASGYFQEIHSLVFTLSQFAEQKLERYHHM